MNTGCGFVLDLACCTGCGACVLACRLENRLPDTVAWRRVTTLNTGRSANGPTWHLSLACHHCSRPSCLAACPAEAYHQREDGLVVLDQEKCLGCRYCEVACSFGAPSWDQERRVMTKCDLCAHRLDQGRLPACVEACPMHALRFEEQITDEAGLYRHPAQVPGFTDPNHTAPRLRILEPEGSIRLERLGRLRKAINELL